MDLKETSEAQSERLFKCLLKHIESEGIDFYKKFTVEEIGLICEKYKVDADITNQQSYNNAMITMLSCQPIRSTKQARDYFKYISKCKEVEIYNDSKGGGRNWKKYNKEELYLSNKYIKNKSEYLANTISKAGSNESDFNKFMIENSDIKLEGKKSFKINDVYISVDNYFEYNNKKIYVEIDSGNMAKLLVGQYTLLNSLSEYDENNIFLIIHYYKDSKGNKYNADRTNKNLEYINKHVFDNKGIKFFAIHIDDFKQSVINNQLYLLIDKI